MITHVGELTLGAALPGASGAIQAALPDLQNRIAAMASFAPTTGSFAASLAAANATVQAIQSAISLGITLPDMDAQFALALAEIAALQAALGVALAFSEALLAGGVHVYHYHGESGDMGGEFATELSGGLPGGAPTDDTHAIVLATTSPAAWSAMSSVFQVTPP